MAKPPPYAPTRVHSAAKLLREVGGTPAPDLTDAIDAVIGWRMAAHRLPDGRVLVSLPGTRTGQVYASEEDLHAFIGSIARRAATPQGHPLGDAYPEGAGFIEAVPGLIAQLPERLAIAPSALDGSVDGLERLDRAARRFGGQACLDDPVLLAAIVAYVGEVARDAGGGEWVIDRDRNDWEPAIARAGGTFRPFAIFKELLEGGSMCAVVSYDLRWSPGAARARVGVFADRKPAVAPPSGALGAIPSDTYDVLTRYGDGRPWSVRLKVDVEIDGVPLAAGSEAHVMRSGALAMGVLSRAHAVLNVAFPAGTKVTLRTGRDSGVALATLGADQVIQGVPCQAGCFVQFCFHRRQPYLAAATLGATHSFDGVSYAAGTWFSIDRTGKLESVTPAGYWDTPRTPKPPTPSS